MLEEQLIEAQTEEGNKNQEIGMLVKDLEELRLCEKTLKDKMKFLKSDLHTVENEKERLLSENNLLVSSLKSKVTKMDEEKQNLEKVLKEKNIEIQCFKDTKEQLTFELHKNQSILKEKEDILQRFNSKFNKAEKANQVSMNQMDTEIKQLSEKIEVQTLIEEQIRTQLELPIHELEEEKKMNTQNLEKLVKKDEQLSIIVSDMEGVRSALDSMSSAMVDNLHKFVIIQRELEDKRLKVEEYESKMTNITIKCKELEEKKDAKIQVLITEIECLTSKNQSLGSLVISMQEYQNIEKEDLIKEIQKHKLSEDNLNSKLV
ncbi:hypothetical protein SNE40_019818 [Patella caerulea]|uniref:Uncharacterized protein n=1 Tax=Patella caerulea TaxID=87958 RepID=A0AAN8G2M2_PATCE